MSKVWLSQPPPPQERREPMIWHHSQHLPTQEVLQWSLLGPSHGSGWFSLDKPCPAAQYPLNLKVP